MDPQHVVVVIGGAVAGSEAAFQFTQRGIRCIVLEQNERPYGKIEDGLPRWHVNLRRQEMRQIDEKLSHPDIDLILRVKLGREFTLAEILGWGPSAVVLATGAWRDRPLPLPGIDRYVGRGFSYQNPFVYRFNHYVEPDYAGPPLELADGVIVVGGGLASLDVVKILMLETVTRALAARGDAVDLYDAERRGINTVLAERRRTLADLGLSGCTLVYRRRVEDMPVVDPPEDATPEQLERARATRQKLLHKFVEKYLFRVRDRCVPVGYLTDGDRLAGLRVAATGVREGALVPLEGTEENLPSELVISSIGSTPEPIEGIPMHGEVFRVQDPRNGAIEGLDGVFAVGNAVTGRGNIAISQRHGRVVSQHMVEAYLGGVASGYEEVLAGAADAATARAVAVASDLAGRAHLPGERVAAIRDHARALRDRVGHPGDVRDRR
jgi:ferredoxin/flavodoxin---NADP+ reductase